MMKSLSLAGVLAVAFTTAAQAQELVRSGDRVRLQASGRNVVVGVVRAGGTDTVTVQPEGGSAPLRIPTAQIRRLEVSLGAEPPGEAATRDAAVGGVMGFAAGALLSSLSSTDYNAPVGTKAPLINATTVVFTGAGMLLGVANGLMASHEIWRKLLPVRGSRDR